MPVSKIVAAAAALLVPLCPPARAAVFHRHRSTLSRQSAGVTLRKRLHVNDLIAEPGTVELDWGGLYSYSTGTLTGPLALKYTPEGNSLYWGRTEYSVAFDSVASAVNAGNRSTQFSDRFSFTATSVVFDSAHFDIAIAPQVTTLLRNESGVRVGATAIARLDHSGNSLGVTLAWSAGTAPSDTNPAGIWDFGVGYGKHLRRFMPHVNVTFEKATGFTRTTSLFGGVEYQATKRFALDLSGQRYNLQGGIPDRQVLLSMTVNFGKVE